MALCVSNKIGALRILEEKFKLLSLVTLNSKRDKHLNPRPRLRNPSWLTKKNLAYREDEVTPENKGFLREVVKDKIIECTSKTVQVPATIPWTPQMQRTGVIAKKIGIYPLWFKNGKKIQTTLLQVLDNHVIKYFTPEEYEPTRQLRPRVVRKKGCVLIGAEIADPSMFTKDYCGLFKDSGVLPTKWLGRFFVSPGAAPPIGTTITAKHFQVGNYVDVRGKTIDRGFQGVMKRHGFKGMPASHGVTKTHRRGGNIGGGGEKGRVWPGTKMPGHMGNRYRVAKGLKIWRINTKYNVLWVSGLAIPGETNSLVYVFDSKLPLRKPTSALPFPTYFEQDNEEIPEDIFDENVHQFSEPTILFEEK
ncbi:39S ribosomal protein L3, mitochondrial [Anthonomus grandis grandis]|uniref:39S ribosomal protein L3, mitochondrial n=1 Tax=Anthonomus grandis grandis TaxID=2921223 RepID=UPI0021657FC6|nr:39S ribosomal protein L3, mitochondrial [Anthonomus grandis grandis]